MFSALAVGEPSWARFTDGRFDFTPLLVAAGVLLLARILFGVRLRWQVILGAVLAAPLLIGLSRHISYPLTMALLIGAWAAVASVARSGGHSGRPHT